MRPHQKMILIEQYGAGTFMLPPGKLHGCSAACRVLCAAVVVLWPTTRCSSAQPACLLGCLVAVCRQAQARTSRQLHLCLAPSLPDHMCAACSATAEHVACSVVTPARPPARLPAHRLHRLPSLCADMEMGVEGNNTIAIVKHVLVDPPSKQNGPFLEERAHLGALAECQRTAICLDSLECRAARALLARSSHAGPSGSCHNSTADARLRASSLPHPALPVQR